MTSEVSTDRQTSKLLRDISVASLHGLTVKTLILLQRRLARAPSIKTVASLGFPMLCVNRSKQSELGRLKSQGIQEC